MNAPKKYTLEELSNLKEIAQKYHSKMNTSVMRAEKKLPEDLKQFIESCSSYLCGMGVLFTDLEEGVKSGRYQKVSDFLKAKCEPLFSNGVYNESIREYLYYAVDKCPKWAFDQSSMYRRSFRTTNSDDRMKVVSNIVNNFKSNYCLDASVEDILTRNLSEEMKAVVLTGYTSNIDENALAYEIDNGNTTVIDIIKDVLNGLSDIKPDYSIIRGVLKSDNSELHELLGKLLLAARLEEGLRQVICENADCGTVEGFVAIVKVIADNNLIRFSSVKRAAGTWLGIFADPYMIKATDLERINNKMMEMVYTLLCENQASDSHSEILNGIDNPKLNLPVLEEYLSSEDSMKIYTALWSLGVYEINDTVQAIKNIVHCGSRHQILTTGYLCANITSNTIAHQVAKHIVLNGHEDAELMAVYMDSFMKNVSMVGIIPWKPSESNENSPYYHRDRDYSKRYNADLTEYFTDKAEAERYYQILQNIYDQISGKKTEFRPCIFPWFTATLTKSDIRLRMSFIASALNDNDKIDECAEKLDEIEVDYYSSDRPAVFDVLLGYPETAKQKKLQLKNLANKETYTRSRAYEAVKCRSLTKEEYAQMAEMLKYKNSEIRNNIISLIMQQESEGLLETIGTLLADKKEEKRTAALDMVLQLKESETRKELFEPALNLVQSMKNPTSKEQILIDSINKGTAYEEQNKEAIHTGLTINQDATYEPVLDEAYLEQAKATFCQYFPDVPKQTHILGRLKDTLQKHHVCETSQDRAEILKQLADLIQANENKEYERYGEMTTLGNTNSLSYFQGDTLIFVFEELWEQFYQEKIKTKELLYRLYVNKLKVRVDSDYTEKTAEIVTDLIGKEYVQPIRVEYDRLIAEILEYLCQKYIPKNDAQAIAAYTAKCLLDSKKDLVIPHQTKKHFYDTEKTTEYVSAVRDNQIVYLLLGLDMENKDKENLQKTFPLRYLLQMRMTAETSNGTNTSMGGYCRHQYYKLFAPRYLRAVFYGIISKDFLYKIIFTEDETLQKTIDIPLENWTERITEVFGALQDYRFANSTSGRTANYRTVYVLKDFFGTDELDKLDDQNKAFAQMIEEIYNDLVNELLSVELFRGDSETKYSKAVMKIQRIYGVKNYVTILTALGKDTLERSYYYYGDNISKRRTLGHLLTVCLPEPTDNETLLAEALKGKDITKERLIEAALFTPEWIDITEKYLKIDGFKSGCYYFSAHMNEHFDDKRKAIIARYTPLSVEELNHGAFDLKWFKEAYTTLGEKNFGMIYKACKYISSGAQHTRARKYADASLGKLELSDMMAKVEDKRNKDLLMAIGLVPIQDDNDILNRYVFIQKFLKGSKKFGSQRQLSEKIASQMAVKNLAINAGYEDSMRLSLVMEYMLVNDKLEMLKNKTIGEVTVRLNIGEDGKTTLLCEKNGKTLKSVPAKLKKDEYIVRLNETKKAFNDQYKRTLKMLEDAMENQTAFETKEIEGLLKNPVTQTIAGGLVYRVENAEAQTAYCMLDTDNEGKISVKENFSHNEIRLSDNAVQFKIAHTYQLYADGVWHNTQKYMYDHQIRQGFKQVFRELYVKTAEELNMKNSRRYAGHQIQPQKTVAVLKGRHWVADIEDGLQKVYYKEKIVARIYAIADWFSPSDIEAPTLEWVEFSTTAGEAMTIKDIPEIIFSEVMRDVDLAVSVAHSGGVDPETSHSTVEMRASMLSFTLPLFGIHNVKIEGSHAHIEGTLADYNVHLGSGIVHQKGGTMLNILPVHSSYRGRLFLPFLDEDPKTAEVISKVIYLAEDDKIKDPQVLGQLNR